MYFEIMSASGGVRLNIKGDNNEIMLQSEVYTSKAGAQNAIDEIKTGAATAQVKTRLSGERDGDRETRASYSPALGLAEIAFYGPAHVRRAFSA
jgi:uncharacterized protein YegP (UPF0339 family)